MSDDRIFSIPLVIRIKALGENYYVSVPIRDENLAEKIYVGRATVRDIINYLSRAMDDLPEIDREKIRELIAQINEWDQSGSTWQVAIVSESGEDLASYSPDEPIPEIHIARRVTSEGLEINSIDINVKPIPRGG